jgi:uncharacterized 2Fe-2S/4Fe-4S cluster protein (DUF4445 family)
VWLNILPDQLWLKVRRGITVWEALQDTDLELPGDCGGLGKCGKCKITVISALGEPRPEEKELLEQEELARGVRLACRTTVMKDMQIDLGDPSPALEYNQILKVGHRPVFHIAPLVDHVMVASASDYGDETLSNLDRIKLALGPEYRDMEASLECLRTLPATMEQDGFVGVATIHRNRLLALQEWNEAKRRYGLVFDLGTSTLVGKLINLVDGQQIAAISCLNGQSKYGADVITRLQYVKTHPDGLQELHKLLVRDLNRIAHGLLKVGNVGANDVFVAVMAGNTTMQHLMLGLSPLGIAEAPFVPVLTDGVVVWAAQIGLRLHPEAVVYMLPMRSGYVGGDMLSVILASAAAEQDRHMVLGLDLGTNGEIFLGNSRRMLTCSTAAGPALEGARISHGMIARTGAIEGVTISDHHIEYQVISNTKPAGLCGSGLVDLVAVLLHSGIIQADGYIPAPSTEIPRFLGSRVVDRGDVNAFLIADQDESYDGRSVFLTQKDVRELQLAKGAVAAGIQALCDEMGIGVQEIDRVCLAGALGNYVNIYSAIRIGLIPQVNPNIVVSLGNAASTGAEMVLLSKDSWHRVKELNAFVEHLELSTHGDFNRYFIDHLDFPDLNIW